ADCIGCRPAEQRADEGAECHDTDDEPLRGGIEMELGNDEEQRPRDHAGVEAEEETAECGDQRDERRVRYGAASRRGPCGSLRAIGNASSARGHGRSAPSYPVTRTRGQAQLA